MKFIAKDRIDYKNCIESKLQYVVNGTKKDFRLNNVQKLLFEAIEGYKVLLVSASRQLGITTGLLTYLAAYLTDIRNEDKVVYFVTHSRAYAIECRDKLVDLLQILDPSWTPVNQRSATLVFKHNRVVFSSFLPNKELTGEENLIIVDNAAFIYGTTALPYELALNLFRYNELDKKLIICSSFNSDYEKDLIFEPVFKGKYKNTPLDDAARISFNWKSNGDKDESWFLKRCQEVDWNYTAIQTELNGLPVLYNSKDFLNVMFF